MKSPKKRKKSAQSPTRLTVAYFRKLGCLCQNVEQFVRIPGGKSFRRDLFNCIDIIVIAGCDTIGVQASDHTSHSKRLEKSKSIPEIKAWLHPESNRKFLVVTWQKKGLRWKHRTTQVTLENNELVSKPFYLH